MGDIQEDFVEEQQSRKRAYPFGLDPDLKEYDFDARVHKAKKFKNKALKIYDARTSRPFTLLLASLHRLMTNGQMEESQSGSADLPDENPDIFLQFLRVAYQIAASDPDNLTHKKLHNSIIDDKTWVLGDECDECYERCRKSHSKQFGTVRLMSACDVCKAEPPYMNGFRAWCEARWRKHNYHRVSNTLHPLDQDIPGVKKFEKDPDKQHPKSSKPMTSPGPLKFCAQMYLFADKYLIPDMAVTCLRAFEIRLKYYHDVKRDLESEPDLKNQDELYDLLYFLDSNMTDAVYPVRRSLFRYILANIDELIQQDDYVEFMNKCGRAGVAISEAIAEAMSVDH